eukprot:jgi/Picsp_1/2420/NSC_05881-R1_hypothetical protein CHLNCDRAFT_56850 [Chlorella variabilis]
MKTSVPWLGDPRKLSKTCWAIVAFSLLNIIFASAMVGVVATKLKVTVSDTDCLLNLDGDVCTFTYVTALITLLIACGIAGGFLLFDYTLVRPLQDVVAGSSLFLAFWQFVMSLTITIRGGQASDAGYPNDGARKTAIAFGWICMSSSLGTALVTMYAIWAGRPKKKKKNPLGNPSATAEHCVSKIG